MKKALEKDGYKDEVNYNLAISYIQIGQLNRAYKAIMACLKINIKYPNGKKLQKDIEVLLKHKKDITIGEK